jgi:hypothetical protein
MRPDRRLPAGQRSVYVGSLRGYSVAAAKHSGVGYAIASDPTDESARNGPRRPESVANHSTIAELPFAADRRPPGSVRIAVLLAHRDRFVMALKLAFKVVSTTSLRSGDRITPSGDAVASSKRPPVGGFRCADRRRRPAAIARRSGASSTWRMYGRGSA